MPVSQHNCLFYFFFLREEGKARELGQDMALNTLVEGASDYQEKGVWELTGVGVLRASLMGGIASGVFHGLSHCLRWSGLG